MSLILGLDTTTNNCSVAIYNNGQISQKFALLPRQHNKNIHRMIQELLHEQGLALEQLDYIAVTIGPGSFTGVRLGISVAQGLAFGLQLKIIPISSLATMACHFCTKYDDAELIIPALDARMQQLYWGVYSCSSNADFPFPQINLVQPEKLSNPEDIMPIIDEQRFSLVGSAWDTYSTSLPDKLRSKKLKVLEPNSEPQAYYVVMLAAGLVTSAVAISAVEACYLRNDVAKVAK